MIPERHFIDNCPRVFVPYKGFCKILNDGTEIKDDIFVEKEGPLKIIVDTLSHGKWHTLRNIVDRNGNKLLSKGIRFITYYDDGYYLLEDNNEDELINSGEVKGGFNASKYESRMNVIREDGTLLSDEWFETVIPQLGFFRVCYSDKRWYQVLLSGELFESVIPIKFGCVIKQTNNGYTIYSSNYDKIIDDYTSIMWSDKGLWEVNLLSNGVNKTFFNGQGGEIVFYAHEILIMNDVIALVEKDDIWYSLDTKGNLTQRFIWRPVCE